MPSFDRYELYELCVQSPPELVRQLVAIHGGTPRVLGEDFCGTAAISVEWTRRVDGGRAIAVDQDPDALSRVPGNDSIVVVAGDVVRGTDAARHAADVIWAGNFSIGEWHTRETLLRYLSHVRARLNAGGVFVCDIYGGETSFLVGSTQREHRMPGGQTVTYTWEQRDADPLTGRVVCAIHFETAPGIVLRDAFVYDWRLWGLPELREAMIESGFTATEVYSRTPDAVDGDGRAYVDPLNGPDDLDDSFDVLVAGRT